MAYVNVGPGLPAGWESAYTVTDRSRAEAPASLLARVGHASAAVLHFAFGPVSLTTEQALEYTPAPEPAAAKTP